MAYVDTLNLTTATIAKFATKPEWLSPNDKAKVYATKEGWVYKDATPGAKPELLVTIPGLSDILDRNTSGALDTSKVYELLVPPTDVGFVRKSARRYAINVGLHESVIAKNGAVTFTLRINGAGADATAAQDTAGNNIVADLSVGTPLTTTIAHDPNGQSPFGKVQFDLPVLSANPSLLRIKLGTTALTVNTIGNLFDAEDNQMATIAATGLNSKVIKIIPAE